MRSFRLFFCLVSMIVACDDSSDGDLDATTGDASDGSLEDVALGDSGNADSGLSGEAEYEVVFQAAWTAASHPMNFPSGAHFSPLVGAVHGSAASIWNSGATSTLGFEQMAETGGTSTLVSELEALAGVEEVVVGPNNSSTGSVMDRFTVSTEAPLVTLVTMIAPSPDWFVGVHDLDLRDGAGFRDEVVVDLFAYDAGTDGGASFASGNMDTQPKQPIALITDSIANAVFGTFTFRRVDSQ